MGAHLRFSFSSLTLGMVAALCVWSSTWEEIYQSSRLESITKYILFLVIVRFLGEKRVNGVLVDQGRDAGFHILTP